MRFSVCIDMIFDALPLPERIALSAACGASAIEFWGWRDKDLGAIVRAKEAAGVDVAAFGAIGDLAPNDPAAAEQAATELLAAVEAAREVGAAALVVHSARELPGLPRAAQLDAIAALLERGAQAAERGHVTLLLEPRNSRIDWPGNLLSSTADALAIVDQVNRPNVKMLFDVYHQHITEGSVLHSIESSIGRIGHFHVADVPGRGQPGTGALDFVELFKLIESLGYRGYVGLEFRASGDPMAAVKNTIHLL